MTTKRLRVRRKERAKLSQNSYFLWVILFLILFLMGFFILKAVGTYNGNVILTGPAKTINVALGRIVTGSSTDGVYNVTSALTDGVTNNLWNSGDNLGNLTVVLGADDMVSSVRVLVGDDRMSENLTVLFYNSSMNLISRGEIFNQSSVDMKNFGVVPAYPVSADGIVMDFDGDGFDDYLMINDSGDYSVGISNGTSFDFLFSGSIGDLVHSIGFVGEFNGDKKDDFISYNNSTREVFLVSSNGTDFNVVPFGYWGSDINWSIDGFADLNGDGMVDIVGLNRDTSDWLAGMSNGTSFSADIILGNWNRTDWNEMFNADFDGDGREDLLVRNSSGYSEILFSVTDHFLEMPFDYANISGYVYRIGDFNGDSKADILSVLGGVFDLKMTSGSSLIGLNRNIVNYSSWNKLWTGNFVSKSRKDFVGMNSTSDLTFFSFANLSNFNDKYLEYNILNNLSNVSYVQIVSNVPATGLKLREIQIMGVNQDALYCNDNDGGLDYYVSSSTWWNGTDYSDVCMDDVYLKEYYCNGRSLASRNYTCMAGCDEDSNACNSMSDFNGLDFGGMYGTTYDSGEEVDFVNPATDELNCPDDYIPYTVLYQNNVSRVVFCYRPHVSSGSYFDFGGMFGFYEKSTSMTEYLNPATEDLTCSENYSSSKVSYSTLEDYTSSSAEFCYRDHVSGVSGFYRFGGMYGYMKNGSEITNIVNPVTGSMDCPTDYLSAEFIRPLGFSAVKFCYEETSSPPKTCSESDGGRNLTLKGNLVYGGATYNDLCTGNNLTEYYCSGNGFISEKIRCNSCVDGVCNGTLVSNYSSDYYSNGGYVPDVPLNYTLSEDSSSASLGSPSGESTPTQITNNDSGTVIDESSGLSDENASIIIYLIICILFLAAAVVAVIIYKVAKQNHEVQNNLQFK